MRIPHSSASFVIFYQNLERKRESVRVRVFVRKNKRKRMGND